MSHIFPIMRMGWREAKELIEKEKCKLLEYDDGHAELLEPEGKKISGGKGLIEIGGSAMGFLTKHSVELLKKNLENKEE